MKDIIVLLFGIVLLTTATSFLAYVAMAMSIISFYALLWGLLLQCGTSVALIVENFSPSPGVSDPSSITSVRSRCLLLFVHIAAGIHSVVAVMTLEATAQGSGALAVALVAFVWTELTLTLLVLVSLHWRKTKAPFALAGIAVAAFVFASVWFYTPSLYGWDLRPLGWYAVLITFIPMMLFAALLLRHCIPLFSQYNYLWRGLIAVFLLMLLFGVALHMFIASSSHFRVELNRALNSRPDEVNFAELTDFEWETVELYGAYTYESHFSPAARNGLDRMTKAGFGINEGFYLVVFINKGRVVHYESIPSRVAQFGYVGVPNPIRLGYDEAIFVARYRDFDRDGRGSRRLRPAALAP